MIDYFSGNNWPPASNFDFFASRLSYTLAKSEPEKQAVASDETRLKLAFSSSPHTLSSHTTPHGK